MNIYSAILNEINDNKKAVLCILLDTSGSTPREAGAKLAVFENGGTFGTIGGGAVEYLGIRLARDIIKSGEPAIREYSLSTTEEGIGMVCGGKAAVGFFRFGSEHKPVLEKLINADGNAYLYFPLQKDKIENVFCIDKNNEAVFAEKGILLNRGPVFVPEKYYSEPIVNSEICRVFGGGHVSKALVPILKSIGFDVFVYDNRPEIAVRERFPQAESVALIDYNKTDGIAKQNEYVVVMTHGHEADFEVLHSLMANDYAYLGCIGSRKKVEFINEKLRAAGVSEEKIKSIHSPIGLNIGAKTPEEIAVSIAAEIIKVRSMP